METKEEGAENGAGGKHDAAAETGEEAAEDEESGEDGGEEDADLEDEEGAEVLLAPAVAQAEQAEQFNNELKERLKADVDKFEEMVVHEEQIRLGDEGWKGRYYKACTVLSGVTPCVLCA